MIRLISDVHGAVSALRGVAARPGPLLILGDLINFIDYRTYAGIVTDVAGEEFVSEIVRLRTNGDFAAAGDLWREHSKGREAEYRRRYTDAIGRAYADICAPLAGVEAYVTYGNVDNPEILQQHLPASATYIEAGVVELEGLRIGIVGGGVVSINTPGEIDDATMAERLAALGPVDILCTHVPPAIAPLAKDVIGGRQKGSPPVRDYLLEQRPHFHYFGDIHQPQAVTWKVGDTFCRNVGYFRATRRVVYHRAG